jgi:hypothetical protein
VAAATTGKTYRSDGAGSGAWEKIQGWGQYQDSRTTVGSPVFNIATGVRTKYLNNGAGLTLEYLPSDATVPLWNVTTNKHIPVAENDVYDMRTTSTTSVLLSLLRTMGVLTLMSFVSWILVAAQA